MSPATFTPKAYLLDGCPYSFRFLLFVSEAGLLDELDVVRCDASSDELDEIKERVEAATGDEMTFPTVEVAPDEYLSDSEQLIAHFADAHDIDPAELPALSFYEETIFPQLEALHS